MLTTQYQRLRALLVGVALAAALATTAASGAMALEIGKPAPDFSLPGTTGEMISLRQFRGKKIVLLEFFGAAFAPT
jgi:thioredoxin-dependent peroxiredoxin